MKSIRTLLNAPNMLFFRQSSTLSRAVYHRAYMKMKLYLNDEIVESADLEMAAHIIEDYTEEQLEKYMQEVQQVMTERSSLRMTEADFIEASVRLRYGKEASVPNRNLQRTVAHEAGHLVTAVLLNEFVVYAEVVLRASGLAGFIQTYSNDEEAMTKEEALNLICIALAGIESEKIAGYKIEKYHAIQDKCQAEVFALRVENNMSVDIVNKRPTKTTAAILAEQAERCHQLLTEKTGLRKAYMDALFSGRKLYHRQIYQLAEQPENQASIRKRN